MFRNPIPRRPTIHGSGSSSILSESAGRPLFTEPFNAFAITLDELVAETLLEAARLKNRARKVPEFASHMQRLQDVYRNEIGPMSEPGFEEYEDEHGKKRGRHNPPKASPDDLYQKIHAAWKEAVGQGLSQEEFDKFVSVLDQIRQEWRDSPEGPHKLGPHEYKFEQQHLAGYPAQWLTAGLAGSSRAFDKAPTVGSHGWIWNTPDTGATATAGPGANKGKKGKKGGGEGGGEGEGEGGGSGSGAVPAGDQSPAGIHQSGHTMQTSMGPITPEHFKRKGHKGKNFRTSSADEAINRLANLIPEDINATWDHNRMLMEDDMAAPPGAPASTAGAPGAGGAGGAGGSAGGSANPQATQAFQAANRAASEIKKQLEVIQKAGGLQPDQAKQFQEFGQFLLKATQAGAPAGNTGAGNAGAV